MQFLKNFRRRSLPEQQPMCIVVSMVYNCRSMPMVYNCRPPIRLATYNKIGTNCYSKNVLFSRVNTNYNTIR